MNLVVMDLVYLSMKPFSLYFRIVAKVGNNSDSGEQGPETEAEHCQVMLEHRR